MEKVYKWREVARWETCVSGVRWKGRKGGRIVRWLGWRGGVMRSQFGKGGREAKDKQGFTAGTCVEMIWDRFQGGEITNFLFNYFEGSVEGIINREVEIRGSTVKCGEIPLEEGVGYVKFL